MKRFHNMRHTLGVLAALVLAPLAMLNAADGSLLVRELRCEYQVSPLAIDVSQPRLSWKLETSRPAQNMTAYQVLVATQPDLLEPGRSDVWDSGRVEGDNFTGVLFQGNRLESGRRYLWKVRCWDADGIAGAWSEVASWRMGLQASDDWPKEWLGAPGVGRAPQQGELGPDFHPVWQYRHEFRIKTLPMNATLYVAAVGVADVWVNGRAAGDAVLDPALTEFRKRVPYVARDLTSLLKAGDNCLGIRLGNGFANPIQDVRAFPRLAPRFQAMLRIEYPDGSVESISSSGEWRASVSEVTYNCFFGGESLDARLRNPRWSIVGDPVGQWQAPAIVEAPPGVRRAQVMPPMRVTEIIRPVSVRPLRPDVWVVDMGVNFTGWPRFRGHGKSGEEVRIFWNERVFPDGSVQRENNNRNAAGPPPKENRKRAPDHARYQEVRAVFSGAAQDEFEPRFTYGSGRYVQIEGLGYEPKLSDIDGCMVHTDLPPVGTFECSNDLINRLHAACVRTFRGNWHGMPTDNPARERLGWAREGIAIMEAIIYNFDCLTSYEKWIEDFIDAQAEDGTLPHEVPYLVNPISSPANRNPDPWYTGVICRSPWVLYERYGDRGILRRTYGGMHKYVDLMLRHFPDGLVPSLYRDHTAVGYFQDRDRNNVALTMVAPEVAETFFRSPADLMGGFAFFDSVSIFAKTSAVLGEHANATKYTEIAERIRNTLNARMDPATGAYAKDSQTLQALALSYGIARSQDEDLVFDYLRRHIADTRHRHLATGVPATRDLFKEVTARGRGDLAMDMINQTDYPSYGQMLENGLGVVWERWDGKSTLNQSGLNSIDEWMYHSIAGIQVDPEAVGFKNILFRPGVLKGLTYARATYESIRGTIVSDWKRDGDRLILRIEVPAGSTGTVILPVKEARAVEAQLGASIAVDAEGRPTWKVGSGTWEFQATLPFDEAMPETAAPQVKAVMAGAQIPGHFVGELFGGGIVIWVTPDRQHGLVSSAHDLDGGSGVPWSNVVNESTTIKRGNPHGIPAADGRSATSYAAAPASPCAPPSVVRPFTACCHGRCTRARIGPTCTRTWACSGWAGRRRRLVHSGHTGSRATAAHPDEPALHTAPCRPPPGLTIPRGGSPR